MSSPLYQMVRDYIEQGIRSGRWPAETRIPSENRLVETLGVSRMTVNRAIRELAADGVLIRRQGVGTFVAPAKPLSAMLEIQSIADVIRSRGGVHTCEVRLLRREAASSESAALLGLPSGASVFHALLIHRDRGTPLQLADRYVNPSRAPEFLRQDFTAVTPNEYLMQTVPLTEAEHIIEAVRPDEAVRSALEMKTDEPCLMLSRRTWAGETVVTWSRFYFPGSRHRIGGRFKPGSGAHRIIS